MLSTYLPVMAARGVAEPVAPAAAATLGTAMTLPLAKEPQLCEHEEAPRGRGNHDRAP